MLGLLNFFEVTREGWISPQDGLYYCQKDKNCKNKKIFKWFFPTLPKMPNVMLIVYLPKIFSSVAGLFRLDPLHLLSAGTVLTLEPSVRCVSGVLVCVPHLGSVYWSLVCGSKLSRVPAVSTTAGPRWNTSCREHLE